MFMDELSFLGWENKKMDGRMKKGRRFLIVQNNSGKECVASWKAPSVQVRVLQKLVSRAISWIISW
jgi:hypothetical protein